MRKFGVVRHLPRSPLCVAKGLHSGGSPNESYEKRGTGWLSLFRCCARIGQQHSISGTIYQGYDEYWGDFNISGPNLLLQQGTPDGLNYYGECTAGATCKVSFSVSSASDFCTYCLNLSGGFVGNKTAEFLDPSLELTGSAFYSGGSNLNVPLTISGTIVGYELINCTDGVGCDLGPKVFTVHILGHGTAQLTLQAFVTPISIYGWSTNFTGTASTVPEPVSIVLTGTGLVGMWIRKKIVHAKQA